MPTLYARREPTTDSTTRDMLKSSPARDRDAFKQSHRDVQLYSDAACTQRAARYPWHYSNKPTRRNRYVIHNCFRYNLVWVREQP
jgi:hypothetical protein